jgi:hypothetical protein
MWSSSVTAWSLIVLRGLRVLHGKGGKQPPDVAFGGGTFVDAAVRHLAHRGRGVNVIS